MPRGQYQRIRKVPAGAHVATTTDPVFADVTDLIGDEELAPVEPQPPAFWGRGALLNVRTTGGDYIVTLYPEEYDARSPERAMRFANPALCQNFVSQWYSRQSHDPRAR